MNDDERAVARREILEQVGPLFHSVLEANEWGRLLVHVDHDENGEVRVTSIDVEDIVGDEKKVEEIFNGPKIRVMLPMLAKTVDALSALDGVDLAETEGGTFLRNAAGAFHFLPGLLRVPSMTFETLREERGEAWTARQEKLGGDEGIGWASQYEIDISRGAMTFTDETREQPAEITLIGTFSNVSRCFLWGWGDPNLEVGPRESARELVDAVPQRDMWELTTRQFATDEPTAWHLALMIADNAKGEGVYRIPQEDGMVYLLVRKLGERQPRKPADANA